MNIVDVEIMIEQALMALCEGILEATDQMEAYRREIHREMEKHTAALKISTSIENPLERALALSKTFEGYLTEFREVVAHDCIRSKKNSGPNPGDFAYGP